MRRKKRTEFRLDIDETLVFRRQGSPLLALCAECNKMGQMISVDEAATLTHTSSRAIYRAAERGEIHFIETSEGLLRVCLKSLYSNLSDAPRK